MSGTYFEFYFWNLTLLRCVCTTSRTCEKEQNFIQTLVKYLQLKCDCISQLLVRRSYAECFFCVTRLNYFYRFLMEQCKLSSIFVVLHSFAVITFRFYNFIFWLSRFVNINEEGKRSMSPLRSLASNIICKTSIHYTPWSSRFKIYSSLLPIEWYRDI